MKTTKQRLMELAGLINENASVIGKPIRIGNLEVAQYDFPQQMNYRDADAACQALGGWRLPTKEEGSMLFKNKAILGLADGQGDAPYWLAGQGAAGWGDKSRPQLHAVSGLVDNDDAINYKNNVRAVRG